MPVIVQVTIQDVPDEQYDRTSIQVAIQSFGIVSPRAMQQAQAVVAAAKNAIIEEGKSAGLAIFTEPGQR